MRMIADAPGDRRCRETKAVREFLVRLDELGRRPSTWRLVVSGALLWVAVGAEVTTVVIAPTIDAWPFVIFHLVAAVAAVLGAIQGGWTALVRRDPGVSPVDWAVRGRCSASGERCSSSPPPPRWRNGGGRSGGVSACSSPRVSWAGPPPRIGRQPSSSPPCGWAVLETSGAQPL